MEERGYGIYASYKVSEIEHRRDNDGREYVDFEAEFMNADNELVTTEAFTAKLQSELVFGIFDQWKILSSHCMIKDFQLTVPAGSEVYLNGELLDTVWIDTESTPASLDCYQIPGIRQGKASLVIRHPALESVNTTLDVQGESADYSDQMALKELAKNECLEMGISALKQLYASSVTEKTDDLEELFADCLKAAKKFVKSQGAQFNAEGIVFKTAAVSEFVPQFDDVVFSEEENGAITTQMTLTYHYVVSQDVTGEASSEEADETSEENEASETNTTSDSHSGENKAVFTMAFYDDAWHITAIDIPEI
jgi:hypothetical protein